MSKEEEIYSACGAAFAPVASLLTLPPVPIMRVSLLSLAILSLAQPADAQSVCSVSSAGPTVPSDPSFARGPNDRIRIPVFFHIITGTGGAGYVTPEQIVQQVAVLNSSFAAGNLYSFELIGVSRVENDQWFTRIGGMLGITTFEREAKQALAQDPRHILNIYTVNLSEIEGGFATLPFDLPGNQDPYDEDDYLQGVVMKDTTFPGGTDEDYNLGDLAVHEVGHYLGLYHPNHGRVREGFCPGSPFYGQGDEVDDTPPLMSLNKNPDFIPQSVCPGYGPDVTHSFMNYTRDSYRNRFTSDQHSRMSEMGSKGRPSLGQPAAPERVSAGVTVTLVPNRTFRYGPAETLIVRGVLNADSVAFAERDPLRGWGGIHFTSTAGSSTAVSTLSHVTVSGVRTFLPPEVYPASEEPIGAAVTVVNRNVVITGGSTIERGDGVNSGATPVPDGTVFPTNGVQVTGTSGRLTVTGTSQVRRHGGVGVLATGGGIATVTGQSEVLTNSFGGVRATGYGSTVGVSGYAQVNGNLAPGVRALQQGVVSVRSAGGTQSNTSASGNRGGLYTDSGAGIDAQQCDGTGGPTRPNRFELNFTNGFDASAFGASVVSAPYAFWGTNRMALVTAKDNPSTLALDNRVNDLNTPQPGCAVLGGERAAPGAGITSAAALDGDDAAQARGEASDVVALLAAHARQAAWAGDFDAAFARLAAARAESLTEDDREAVSEATAALLAAERPVDVVAGLAVTAAAPSVDQPWAQRSLAIAYAAGNRAADAGALALTLAESSDADHAAFGHGLLVRLATDAGDATLAVDRLTAFAATAPGDEALGSSVALVAATFPDADLSGVLGRSAGRSAAGRSAAGSATGGAAPAVAGRSAEAAVNALDVYPNPAAVGQATVRVTLAAATTSAVATVYDALGRVVAVLHAGSLAAGPTEFALGSLAPGVYVVHVRTVGEAGGEWADLQRITVTR